MGSIPNNRLLSLDAFRGFTIAAMILVNSPGSYRAVYSQFKHAPWNGWTFADTIFPCFLFIMGVSMMFSLASCQQGGLSCSRVDLKIVKRTLILFGLGLFMNSYPIFHISTLRVPGVLQRIALCYFFTSIIVRKLSPRGQFYCIVGLLTSYWLMMRLVPIPEATAATLEPGNNLAAYVDSLFLQGHMWAQQDPEGIVGTLPAIGITLFGTLTGIWLRSNRPAKMRTAGMILAGTALLALGTILDTWLPINKNLWTSTYTIFMAGIALLSLAVFYWVIDVAGYKRWAKVFVIFGMNAIAIYFLCEVLDTSLVFIVHKAAGSTLALRSYLFRSIFAPLASPEGASLLFALSYLFLMFLVAWAMWRMRIFIKI